jgi:AbrB family looped-hinge helix DNA binding protein
MKAAVVAERGQVTIPKSLREKLGISPGTVLEFDIECRVGGDRLPACWQ